MKKLLAGAAAAAAILAPTMASADTNAVVGLQYSSTEIDGVDDNLDNYGFNGAFSHDLNNGAVLQVDGEWGRTDFGGDCCIGSSYGAAHYGVRNESYSFGGFVGLADFFSASGLGGGVEGQLFLGNLNLNGAVGVVDFDDFDLSTTSAQVDAAYFFTPNLALTGLVAQTEADFGGGGDSDWTTLGIGGEWRMSASPISLVAGYRNADYDGGEADTWTIGVNFDLGTGSLQERTRSGPGFTGGDALFGGLGGLTP